VDGAPPSIEQVKAFLATASAKTGKREIARALGIGPDHRAWLKQVLRDLEEEGTLERRGRRLHVAGELPPVFPADIVGRDRDGELLAEPSEWEGQSPKPKILILTGRRKGPGPTAGVGDRVLLRAERVGSRDGLRTGRIVKLLSREKAEALGVFRSGPDGGRIVPVDKKALGRELFVPSGQEGGAEDGDLVSATVLQRSRLGLPQARVIERLGSLRSEKAVSLVAIHQNNIPHVFSPDVIAESEEARPATLAGREDWREVPLITIDPADAKDHDDAVHARLDDDPGNSGGFVVTVAIADVAAYVRPGSALDREAFLRGNSVYFPDRVVPMLPERISNDLCSLKPQVARPAVAVRMVVGADGRKRRHSFHRVMMRSAAKLSYVQAQAAIDGRPDDTAAPLLESVLRPLWAAYECLARARDHRGPLFLDLPERKIILDQDGRVERVTVPERLAAHRLIEEFMILANVAAAETLEEKSSPLIYRVHDEPSLEKMRSLGEVLASIGFKLPKDGALRPALFNRILGAFAESEHQAFVNEVVLRSQAQAEYAPENYGHFGLNLRRYAHFTSPIRRYADLVVHRALVGALGFGSDGLPKGTDRRTLVEVSEAISQAERRAMAAERQTVDRLIAFHLADRIGATFGGRISGVTRSGLFVKLTETGADGFIPASTIGDDYYRHDEAQHALVGDRSGEMHRLGDVVEVKLVEAQPVAGALRFELLSEGRPSRGTKPTKSRRPSAPAARPSGVRKSVRNKSRDKS
jgi:ribonuclease R